jgi:hypothetical protein
MSTARIVPPLQPGLQARSVHVGDRRDGTGLHTVDQELQGAFGLRRLDVDAAVRVVQVAAPLEQQDLVALQRAARIGDRHGVQRDALALVELRADVHVLLPRRQVVGDAEGLELVSSVVVDAQRGVRIERVEVPVLRERRESCSDQVVLARRHRRREVAQQFGSDVPAEHPAERPDLEPGDVRRPRAGDGLRDELGRDVRRRDRGDVEREVEVRLPVGDRQRLGEELLVAGVVGPEGQVGASGTDGGRRLRGAAGEQRAEGDAAASGGAPPEQVASARPTAWRHGWRRWGKSPGYWGHGGLLTSSSRCVRKWR